MNQFRRPQWNRQAQRGVSLIEVLVVLAILVLGILVIVELFPRGFFSIESAGTAANADSLGLAMIQGQSQNSVGLPDAILPGGLSVLGVPNGTAAEAAFDPDDPNHLEDARVISNETITIPSPAAAVLPVIVSPSIYVVNYGPIVANSMAINGTDWQAITGDSATESGVTPVYPQNTIFPGQEKFLVDLTNGKIAVPYSSSYSQTITMEVVGKDGMTYTLLPTLPHAGSSSSTDPHDPMQPGAYIADSSAYYNGNWFDPKDGTLRYDTVSSTPPTPWKSVRLYRAFHAPTAAGSSANPYGFDTDPYEFTLINGNIGSASDMNLGAVAFNPLAARGNGYSPLQAQITYQTYRWDIIHEDRDIPALTSGGQYIARLTLKRLKANGLLYPDSDQYGTVTSATYAGIFGGGQDVVILDLDTGQPVPGSLINEDKSGTSTSAISVGHSVGRLVFPYAAFGGAAHRIRAFYQVVGDWTAAVQKAPRLYSQEAYTGGSDPLLAPAQYAYDSTSNIVYFPRSDAGKTVELDGAYTVSGTTTSFSDAVSIDPAVYPLGGTNYVRVDLTDPQNRLATPIPAGATVTFTAIRGLSTRAVVAWKENYHWKVHDVDTVLTRAQ